MLYRFLVSDERDDVDPDEKKYWPVGKPYEDFCAKRKINPKFPSGFPPPLPTAWDLYTGEDPEESQPRQRKTERHREDKKANHPAWLGGGTWVDDTNVDKTTGKDADLINDFLLKCDDLIHHLRGVGLRAVADLDVRLAKRPRTQNIQGRVTSVSNMKRLSVAEKKRIADSEAKQDLAAVIAELTRAVQIQIPPHGMSTSIPLDALIFQLL